MHEAGLGYSLFSALVWLVITLGLQDSTFDISYPFYGSWILALVFDIAIDGLYLASRRSTDLDVIGLILRLVRICSLVALLGLAAARHLESKPETCDEENQPLLNSTRQYGSIPQASDTECCSAAPEASGVKADEPNSDACTDWDDDDKQSGRTERDPRKGWQTYLSAFLVFLPFTWPTKRPLLYFNVAGVGICLLVERFMGALVPLQLGIVIDTLSDRRGYLPWKEIGLFVLLELLHSPAGISLLRNILWLPVDMYTRRAFATTAFNHLMDLSCDFHDNKKYGTIWQSIDRARSVMQLTELVLFELIPVVIDLVVALSILYWIFDVYISFIFCTVALVYLWSTNKVMAKRTLQQRDLSKKTREEFDVLCESTYCWQTVSYLNRIQYEKDRYDAAVQATRASAWYHFMLSYLKIGVQNIAITFGLLAACYLAGYQIAHQGRKVGDFVLLLRYWDQLSHPLRTLVSGFSRVAESLIDAESLLRLLQRRPAIFNSANATKFILKQGEVEFSGVGFSYDGQREILRNLSFRAEPGTTVALVGSSGGGKSTILKLLFRFYDVTKGSIKIDGQDIRDVTLETLRDSIGVVPQDAGAFNRSIMDNIKYGKLDATEHEVHEACKAVALHSKIMSFSNGYQSRVGERGVKLSGGELQRLAIARAIIKNPKIVLLDEATSSVDTETERQIQDSFQKLCAGRTTVVIAHRLSTIINADQILVIRNGEVIERGTHEKLLRLHGQYHNLWEKQIRSTRGESRPRSTSPTKRDDPVLADELMPIGAPHPLMAGLRRHVRGPEGDYGTSQNYPLPETYSTSAPESPHSGRKARAVRKKQYAGSLRRKVWKPDAPEFVPQTLPRAGPVVVVPHQLHVSARDVVDHHEAAGIHLDPRDIDHTTGLRANKENDFFSRNAMRSVEIGTGPSLMQDLKLHGSLGARREGMHSTVGSDLASSARAIPPSDKTNTPSVSFENDEQDLMNTSKKRKIGRRILSKSEPSGHMKARTDSTDAASLEPAGPLMDGHPQSAHRCVTGPSDPPSGQSTRGVNAKRQQRQKGHWKIKRSSYNTGSSASTLVAESSNQQSQLPASSATTEGPGTMRGASVGPSLPQEPDEHTTCRG